MNNNDNIRKYQAPVDIEALLRKGESFSVTFVEGTEVRACWSCGSREGYHRRQGVRQCWTCCGLHEPPCERAKEV